MIYPSTSDSSSDTFLNGYKIIIIVANGVGNCYYDIAEYLTSFGADVTTVGLTKTVMTCGNKGENRILEANITINEITNVSIYDAIVVPSGGYWGMMINQKPVLDLLVEAYQKGLIISSFCVGTAILAVAGILDDVCVLSHEYSNYYVRESGAKILTTYTTVSDSRIVTGDKGGGLEGGGFKAAPLHEFCVAIAKELLGRSFAHTTEIKSLGGGEFFIETETHALDLQLVNRSSIIASVSAFIYNITDGSYYNHISLSEVEESNFSGEFMIEEVGSFRIDLRITDSLGNLEIIRNIGTASLDNTTPGWDFFLVLFSLIGLIYIKKNRI